MKKIVIFLMIFSAVSFCAAGTSSDSLMQLRKSFYGGSLSDKIDTVQKAADKGISELFVDSLDFIGKYSDLLKDDPLMVKLARITVENSGSIKDDSLVKSLQSIFSAYTDKSVRLAVLKALSVYKLDDTMMKNVNSFAASFVTNYEPSDYQYVSEIIDLLKKNGDVSSVYVLLEYAGADLFPSALVKKAGEAIPSFSPDYKPVIVDVLANGTPEQKLIAFHAVVGNSEDTDFFKAEIAEKALSSTIISIGGTVQNDADILKLQFEALNELRRVAWTRSSALMVKLFHTAEKEYAAGYISEDAFIDVMKGLVELASGEAGATLSDYLAGINTRTENGEPYNSNITLSVIKMLGTLGDKVAFDSLLYVSYLSYEDKIIEASRIALAGLKW